MQLHFSSGNQMLSCTELHLVRNCRLGSFSPCISKFSISQKYSTLNIKAIPSAYANMFFLSRPLKKIVYNLVFIKHTANMSCFFLFFFLYRVCLVTKMIMLWTIKCLSDNLPMKREGRNIQNLLSC